MLANFVHNEKILVTGAIDILVWLMSKCRHIHYTRVINKRTSLEITRVV